MDTLCNTVGLTSPTLEAKEAVVVVVVAFVKRLFWMETKVVVAFARGGRPHGGGEAGNGNA